MLRALYRKRIKENPIDSLQLSEDVSKLMENVMRSSNPSSQLENMLKYGFNINSMSVMGIQDIMRQIRRKKLEDMKKNLAGTYEREISTPLHVKDEEMSEIGHRMEQLMESKRTLSPNEYEDEIADLRERAEMLSSIPQGFKKDLMTLDKYSKEKNFMSQNAKQMFEDLMNKVKDIERLSEFLRRHPYGFNEGQLLSLKEALEVVDRFEKLEELENNLREGLLHNIPPDTIGELLGDEVENNFQVLQKIVEVAKESGHFIVQGTTFHLTPRAVRKIGYKILQDIFSDVRSKLVGMHATKSYGCYEIDYEQKKKWEFGDNINFDVSSTLKNAISCGRYDDKTGEIKLSPEDFEIYKQRHLGRSSTALLIDTSWSMSWGNKFECAKKVAIALHSLTTSFFPNDTLYIIAFFTVAMEIKPHELLSIELNMNDPFTNMQDAIRLARRLLKKSPADDKQIIIVTDGQPTAYCLGNRVFVEWPVMGCSPNAMRETLKEVQEATKENVRINIFMVEENSQIEKFVEEIVRINKGRAFFTKPETLGKYLILDFVSRKRYIRR